MFRHVVGFELRYQLKSPIFWGTSIIFFLLTFASVVSDDIRIGWGGQVFRNSPFAIAMMSMIWSIFAMFIVTAFVSNVVLRDDETGFGPIIQATRLSKFDYLFGRFTGGFLAASFAFLSVPLGALMAVVIPGPDPETIGPIRLYDYLYVYLLFCVPTLFVMSAGFFALATATRSMIATYVGALVVLAIYLFTSVYLRRPEFGAASTLSDPFGLATLAHVTRYWTAHDRNTMLPPFLGLMLQSRAIWGAVALGLLALAWRAFTRQRVSTRADRKSARREAREAQVAAPASGAVPPPPTNRGLGWSPLAALTRFEVQGVLRGPVFIVLLGFAFINTVVGLWLAGDDSVTIIYPVTRVMIQTLLAQFTTIPLFIAAFYAGELVWRDRERRIHEIVDATPSPDWAFLVPKILAISFVLLAMGVISIIAAVAVQLLKGFTDIEIGHYLSWYLAPWFVTMVLYSVLAVFVQTLAPHKFVGLLIMLLYFIAETILPTMGFESHLYLYATTPPTPLSDMNGLGKFAEIAAWYRAYWACGAVILAVLSYALWRRGASAPLAMRIRKLPQRLAGTPAIIAGAAAVLMAGLGGWIYNNNYILNDFPTFNESQRWAADYEKTLLPYEDDPQPKITDMRLHVDIYPDAPRAVTRGSYVIENKTGAPIAQLYVSWAHPSVTKSFIGTMIEPGIKMRSLEVPGARLTKELSDFNFRIYTFDTPMAPGERREIHFETVREQHGFRNSGNEDRIVSNGTFLNNFALTPNLGVSRWPLLQDRATRSKYGLQPDLKLSKLEDQSARAFTYLRHDSDYVHADVTLTGPADQVLIAPGQRISHQVKGDRQIAHFRTEAPILNFFSMQAARYKVRKDRWNDIGIEVYYHPEHHYNVDRFVDIAKDGLAYFSKNFSPYQFKQFRIIEFPVYNNFAQAFPGTVPYSEGAGFIAKIDESEGVDFIAYVTAHELAHQWWFHQLTGADMEGSTVLSETLAQYSAIMVMEKRYGEAMIRRFLKRGMEGYLGARGKENVAEPPLERVQEQAYVRYQKGGNVMYLLKDRMGEAAVNRALQSLLVKFAFKGAPYPSSSDLVAALRAEAKPEHQQLITDLFQHITLYDLKTNDAQATRRADGKWDVTFTVEAHKRYADGKGIETEAPLDEIIDVGIFTADPAANDFRRENVMMLKPQRLRTGKQRLTAVVDRKPSFVGIDPYIKYIDRNAQDNVRKVD
ncbi:ABC transporter permease/M1 family aminopeptidase [Sphingosinicella rhizophila]|uniref:M1 family aminopeptidase n=1 Tax=Sphingosinicella rhizophila TaxID=3050082 RepID=A0ABU3Q605_9SPHN|nr:M1 family aminopeptidase [Sphingosinicella sp. GR2756]MDT9598835.1 M1 family aminopeptidase [Sphingosinicella sp. GR2756]